MFDATISLGSIVAAVSVIATWYMNVKRFRREDSKTRSSQHEENQKRLASIERHLGGPAEKPLSERVSVIEVKVDTLERRICK